MRTGKPAGRSRKSPPGPRGDLLAGNLGAFEKNRLGFLTDVRDRYGDLVAFDRNTTIINGPDLATDVLEDPQRSYGVLATFMGGTLNGSSYQERRRVRRHLNAALRHGAVDEATELTRSVMDATVPRGGGVITIEQVTSWLEDAMAQVEGTLFLGDDAGELLEPLQRVFEHLDRRAHNPFCLPQSLPTPTAIRLRRAYSQTRQSMDPILRRRLAITHNSADVASRVMRSASRDHSVSQVADLLIGAMLASLRVPAAGAAWCLKPLVDDPDLQLSLVSGPTESDRTSTACRKPGRGSRSPMDVVVMETLRLYPPTWILRRISLRPVALGTFEFPAGHNFVLSPFIIHRDARLHADPEAFRPSRWTDERGLGPTYLSFGRGSHRCPGIDLASLLVGSATQSLVDAFHISAISPSGQWLMDSRSSLVPRGVQVRLTPRQTQMRAAGS